MSVETMQELLIDELKDLYSAEKQIVRALPKLAKAASSPQLQKALLSHLEETKGQVERLEKISEIVGKKLTGKTCSGMKGVRRKAPSVMQLSLRLRSGWSITRWPATDRRASSRSCSVIRRLPRSSTRRLPKRKMQTRTSLASRSKSMLKLGKRPELRDEREPHATPARNSGLPGFPAFGYT
jgi:hypothetical protein